MYLTSYVRGGMPLAGFLEDTRAAQQAWFDAIAVLKAANGLPIDDIPDFGPTARSINVSNPYRDATGQFYVPEDIRARIAENMAAQQPGGGAAAAPVTIAGAPWWAFAGVAFAALSYFGGRRRGR